MRFHLLQVGSKVVLIGSLRGLLSQEAIKSVLALPAIIIDDLRLERLSDNPEKFVHLELFCSFSFIRGRGDRPSGSGFRGIRSGRLLLV